MQKENDQYGPFRATRLWDEAVHIFTSMPCKRHRSNMRQYDNCFTGSEAVKWFHQALEKSPYFGAVVTQEKALQLLSKFYDEGIFVRVKRLNNNRQDRFKLHGIYQMNQKGCMYTIRNAWSSSSLNGARHQKSDELADKPGSRDPDYINVPAPPKRTPLRERQLTKNRDVTERGKPARLTPIKNRVEVVCTKRPPIHPVQQPVRSTKSPLSPGKDDDIWRYVFVEHLQKFLCDLDVSGLLWPCAVIRCRWLDHNVNREVNPEEQLPAWFNQTLNRLLGALTNWELNHSIVNPSVETDVEDVISYLLGLPSPMVPADLSTIFHRVFLHLEASAGTEDSANPENSVTTSPGFSSSENVCSAGPLPPNTCYETAFTSEEPVTRIVPQSSIDTIHLPSKARSVTGSSYTVSPDSDKKAFMKRNNSAPNILDAVEDRLSVKSLQLFGLGAKTDGRNYATLGSRGKSGKDRHSSPKCNDNEHECGRLKVLDKTPPAVIQKAERKKTLTLKHVRNQSGGYVNVALNESLRDTDLDFEAAMESLQKLMICSQPNGPRDTKIDADCAAPGSLRRSHSFRSDNSLSSYHSAVSSPRRSSPSWTGCEWGWHWGESKEKLAVAVFRLLLLLLPPQNRACLTQILRLMRCLPSQFPYTASSILTLFSGSIIPETEEDAARRLICFWIRNSDELFVVPPEFAEDVQQNTLHEKRRKVEVEVPLTFCEQVSSLQFEEQKLTTSQQALAELLNQIVKDTKMPPKEKQKRLRMFKDAYPHIFAMRFPSSDEQRSVLKGRPKAALPLGKLRVLRV